MKKIYLITLSFIILSVNQLFSQDTNLVYGCTNPLALNYNPDATAEDFSCDFSCDSNDISYSIEEINAADSYITLVANYTSLYEYNEISWNFGDGNYSNEEYPTHIYEDYGNYAVCVTMWTLTTTEPVDWTMDFDTCQVSFCDSIGITLFAPQEDGFTLNIVSELSLGVAEFNSNISKMEIFPNPANDEITLNFDLKTNEQITYSIYDHSGKIIARWNRNLISGLQNEQINLNDYTSGLYLLELTTNDSRQTKTFQIVK